MRRLPGLTLRGLIVLFGLITSSAVLADHHLKGAPAVSVAAQPDAARAGKKILDAGGNAADAAVAVGFAIAVVEPTMNSIGGRSQILVRDGEGNYSAYNGMTEIPASYVRPEEPVADGYGVIATPGVVAALARLHREHGQLPWADVVAPAIALARDGFVLLPGEAARQEQTLDRIKGNPGFQENFLKADGSAFGAGELLRQPVLANTLERIAKRGAKDFYRGKVAREIARDMKANGGFVTRADLRNYRVLDGRYISTPYHGFEIHSIAAPAGGGLVVKTLNILENFDLTAVDDGTWAIVMFQALALAVDSMADDYDENDLDRVRSKAWATQAAYSIRMPQLAPFRKPHQSEGTGGQAGTDWNGESWGSESHHTTHFATADCAGMTVSITQTLGPSFGSKVVTPGLGFVYASTMGTYLSSSAQSPGSRPRTTIAPTIVTRDGEVVMVLGAAGGLRILSAIVQTISRYIDQGRSIPDAIAAPRVHPVRTVDEETGERGVSMSEFHAETTPKNGWGEADILRWTDAGFAPKPNPRYGAFGRVHLISAGNGRWTGAADPDWEGLAVKSERCNAE